MEKQVKTIPFEIKEINEEDRSFLAVASTEDVDRDNDRIMSTGWDLENFSKNPVVPWAHRYGDPPVARATAVAVVDGRLTFRPKFADREEYAFADTIFRLYKGGFLRAFSVGFMPKRYEIVERAKGRRGYDFLEQELWEISACTVPSNPNALVAAKQKGVISDEEAQEIEERSEGDDTENHVPMIVEALEEGIPEHEDHEASSAPIEAAEAKTEDRDMEKRLERMESQLDQMSDALADALARRVLAEKKFMEGLEAIVARLDEITVALKQPEQAAASDAEPLQEKTPQPETRALDDETMMEIVRAAAEVAIKAARRAVDKRMEYHLGIVK